MAIIIDFDAARVRLAVRSALAKWDFAEAVEILGRRCLAIATTDEAREAVRCAVHEARGALTHGGSATLLKADLDALGALHARLEAAHAEAVAAARRAPRQRRSA